MQKLQCYNRSCGQMFDPDQNSSESCLHHPGLPVFHDAYKKWSCCEKKTTDFTEFLNIKGCTKSYHSNVKPPEPPKSVPDNKTNDEIHSSPQPLQPKETFVRPDSNEPLVLLPSTIGSSLKPVLEKMQKESSLNKEIESDGKMQLNTPCKNKGCQGVYKGEDSNNETCFYHSGMPIFHEGMKYWSCCVKRTTDFNSFLEQVGCATGNHKWQQDKVSDAKTQCRYDWHQTGSSVVISIYSKCPFPDHSYVKGNSVKLHIYVTFGKEKNVFDEEIILFGVVDIASSLVTYLGSKVEVKLKKTGPPLCWKTLALEKNQKDIQPCAEQHETVSGIDNICLEDEVLQ